MHEFTTMYHYFKGISEESPEKSVVELKSMVVSKESNFPPTEECTNDSYSTHYLEMKVGSNESDSNNNEIHAIANLSYLNVDHSDLDSIDTVDGIGNNFIAMQSLIKRDTKDLINNLNSMKIKEEDEKEITNELKITEENYYDSNEFNKSSHITTATAAAAVVAISDDFSNACSDALENISQADSSSLTPSTNSIPSSNSDNNQTSSLHNGDYLIQPSNRPITNLFGDYLTHPSNRPVEQQHQHQTQTADMLHDYMNQSTAAAVEKPEASHLRLYFSKKKKSDSIGSLGSPTKSISSNGTLKRHDSDASSKKSVDDELLEIINDFKNNVFTINEVEELVASWKNRHDVKKSFREKQEQLQRMREEYEKIQQRMKDKLKRPSPFERMKRIFSRKNDKNPPISINLPLDLTGNSNFRPNSTLSLHSASSSNSSSGRMSTSSQASVCDRDSGTHSDHEERRNHRSNNNINNNNLKISQSDNLMDNYLIPPSNPRPVLLSTPLSTTIEDKRSLLSFSLSQNATTTPDLSAEHYILFPSNKPIFPSARKSNENNSFSTFKP